MLHVVDRVLQSSGWRYRFIFVRSQVRVGYPEEFLFSSNHTGKFRFSTLKKDIIASLSKFLSSAFILT
jgi:hypothetical protein